MKRTAEASAATRAALLDAALFEFAEKGVAAATLAGVAARAGVTRGAVYHHFADKAALHLAVLSDAWDVVSVDVWAQLDGPGTEERPLAERLTAFADAWIRALHHDPRFQALTTISMVAGPPATAEAIASQEAGHRAWRDRLAAALTRRPGELAADVDPSTAAVHLFGWLCGLCLVADASAALLPPPDATGATQILRGLLR